MIIKLTTAGKNEVVYVNFDYVRMMRSVDAFTELVMSDDRYHKIAVIEAPEKIYEMLYPVKACQSDCSCSQVENEVNTSEVTQVETKKATAKKTTAKAAETN